jgi:hypothetical protein
MCANYHLKKWVEVQICLSTHIKVQRRYKYSINKQPLTASKHTFASIKKALFNGLSIGLIVVLYLVVLYWLLSDTKSN